MPGDQPYPVQYSSMPNGQVVPLMMVNPGTSAQQAPILYSPPQGTFS